MRLLRADESVLPPGSDLTDQQLSDLYAVPVEADSWLRVNFVSSLDGAVTGADGLSGSLNTDADGVVFNLLRRLSDAVLVGAGTAEAEGYRRLVSDTGEPPALVLVSSRARVPDRVAAPRAGGGAVLLVTCDAAPAAAVATARRTLGADAVITCGTDSVDLTAARAELVERGLRRLLCEGGPRLLGSLLEVGEVDELDLTLAPRLVSGAAGRIAVGPGVDLSATPLLLVEEDGTVMGRWLVR